MEIVFDGIDIKKIVLENSSEVTLRGESNALKAMAVLTLSKLKDTTTPFVEVENMVFVTGYLRDACKQILREE